MRRLGYVLLVLGLLLSVFSVKPALAGGPDWDRSSLSVDGKCVDGVQVFTITNKGDREMQGETSWKLHALTKDGEVIEDGDVPALAKDESFTLTFNFAYKVFLEVKQRPGHPGQGVAWADIDWCGSPTATPTIVPTFTPTETALPTFTLTVPVTATFTPEDTATATNTVVIPTNTVIIPTETLESTPTNTSVVDPTPTVVDPTATVVDPTPTVVDPTTTSIPTGTPVIVITETGQATSTLVLTVPATVTPGSGYSCDDVIKLWKKTGDPRWRQWLDKRPWCENRPTKTPNSPTSGAGDSFSGFSPMTTLWLGAISSLFGLLLVILGGKRKVQY